ncbi:MULTISPECIES: hypothetical protein [Pseudomonas]|uniref:hypothetical protein n=1 Tax=Pseudomonas TaxID=286 RepID=UPI001E52BB17|nr:MULTISPECIES: hypothetical protein [Pseudomonas]MCE1117377.1 hypothetical protein [Pseudomonas sp. NMI795_08]
MVNFTLINIAGTAPALNNAAQSGAAQAGSGTQEAAPLKIDPKLFKADADAGPSIETDNSSEPAEVKELRDMIKRLQKQLAEEQKQLAAMMAKNHDDAASQAAIAAKQASITTLIGQISAATAQLLETLSKAGSSSAGGSVDTVA